MKRLRDAMAGLHFAAMPWRSCACLAAPTAIRYRTSRWWRCPAWLS